MAKVLPPSLEFSKHFVAECDPKGTPWVIFRLDTIVEIEAYSSMFDVGTRENAAALMARLDQIEDAKKATA